MPRLVDGSIAFDDGLECSDCGDTISEGETIYCYSCGDHDDCSRGCEECGDDTALVLCDYHHESHDEEVRDGVACSECDEPHRELMCSECAEMNYGTGTVPLAVINEDGQISVDGMEVNWG